MTALTSVYVAVLPDFAQFGRQFTSQLRRIDASADGKRVGQGFSSGVTGSFKGIAAGLAGAFAAVGAVNLFKGFIQDAAEAAKITRVTENVIASMGGVANVTAKDITSLAGSLAAKTGVDDAAIQAGQNLLLTFGNVRDEAGKGNDVFTQATRLGLDMSVALGTDASKAALQLGKALNDPVKGISALSRAGVSFTAEQKEQIKTLVASGDTLGAQKIILGELEKQFGGTAAAAADPMARLSYVVGELGESVGALLLPAVSAFATFAGEKVIPAVQGLIDGFSSGEGVGGRFAAIFGRIKDAVTVFVEALRGGDVTTLGFLGRIGDLGYMVRAAFGGLKDVVTVFIEALRGGEVTTLGFLGRVGDFGYLVRDAFGWVKDAVTVFVEALRGGEVTTLGFLGRIGDFGYKVRDAFGEVKDGVTGFVEAFRSGGEEITRSGFAGGLQQIGVFARDAFDYIRSDVIPAAVTLGKTLGVMLREVGQGALPLAVAAFKSLFSAMTGVFNFVKANDTVFTALAAGVVAGYVAFRVFTVVSNAFKVAQAATLVVMTAYRAVLQAYALWTYTATGSTTAFAFAMNVLKVAFLTNPIGIVVVGLIALGAALFVAYKKSETFRDIVNEAWATIKGSVGSVVDWFTGTVLPALQGVWRGISSKAMELRDTLAAAWRGISAGFGAVLGAFGAVYDTVIAPVFAAFKADAKLLWTGVQLAWDGIRTGFSAAMTGFRAVYQTLIAPVFVLFRVAAQALWDDVVVVWEGLRAGFGLAMQGIKAVYHGVIVPVFDAYRSAAQVLWAAVQTVWDGIKTGFSKAMVGVKAVYDNVIVPVFNAYRAAGQTLWAGLQVIFSGMRTAFDVAMQGIRAVYNGVIVPLFNAYRSAAQSLWSGLQSIFNAMRSAFDSAMRGMRSVYDGVVRPLFDTFNRGAQGLWAVFSGVVNAIGAAWSTLRDKLRTPIKAAFDFVQGSVVGPLNNVLKSFGVSLRVPDMPRLKEGGPVEGPGGPRDDKVLTLLSDGEYVINAAAAKKFRPLLETLNKGTIRDESAFSSVKRTSLSESSTVSRVRDDGAIVVGAGTAKKHRRLLEDINAGRAPTRLPGDEFGGPVGDVWGTISGAAGAIKGFAADMIAKGARKATELLLNPLKDRVMGLIGSPDNVPAVVLRDGLNKLFHAVFAKSDEKDKELAAAKKAGTAGGGGGIGTAPGGGSQANLVAFGRLMQSMGARASEHPLFGGVHPVHTRNSNHYVGKAIDLNYGPGGQNATEMAFFDKVVAQGMPRRYGLRYIWRSAGHFNHMHVDYDKGGYLPPGAMGVNRGPRPERILTSAQTESFDRLVRVLERVPRYQMAAFTDGARWTPGAETLPLLPRVGGRPDSEVFNPSLAEKVATLLSREALAGRWGQLSRSPGYVGPYMPPPASTPAPAPANVPASSTPGVTNIRTWHFNFNVYNPIAEPTSVTTNRALQRAADLALV